MESIPDCVLRWSGQRMPVLGFGTASVIVEESYLVTKQAVLEAIKLGYRHFDTASVYGSEPALGEAIIEAVSLGLIKSRNELFITSKLWCADGYGDLVLPALNRSLQNLKLDYLDLYLIHWPISFKKRSDGDKEYVFLPMAMDFSSVWAAMEDCQRLGLTKSIGLSNFTCKKVEMNPLWQQKKLKEFCHGNGILLSAYSPLGAVGTIWGSNRVMECEVLKDIAKVKGKTVAQVCLRWVYEQGVSVMVKSFNAERMKQNVGIFDWSLSGDEVKMINQIPQSRGWRAESFVSKDGPFKTLQELWDGEV
ncbi:non-functional NADPH-dependent codeinone reductase 2-like isoform X2 [Hibiscus syriacus]|uniref:non-functional NADPH-dependent codeinone reductase 2-like isoform X2 n=1 Tax=Hibiscus syriacus TaxID=106335 RepID=UPI0019242E1F|nr:non-functional NADPH-dependent codeinone reductase 2-like isoform X2 [Hibiscus syriacus]